MTSARGVAWLLGILVSAAAVAQSIDTTDPRQPASNGDQEATATDSDWVAVKTTHVPVKKLEIILPPSAANVMRRANMDDSATQRTIAGNRLPLPGPAGALVVDGRKLGVDLDGDGQPDDFVKGINAVMQLQLQYEDGAKEPYTIEIVRGATTTSATGVQSSTFNFSRVCYRQATFKGVRLTLIDNDNDGIYNKLGTDALIVGSSQLAAGYLSDLVSIRGAIYELQVNPAGSVLRLRPWTGTTGKVKVNFNAPGKLAAALLIQGNRCFDVSQPGVSVPEGTYQLRWGAVVAGRDHCQVQLSKTVTVTADSTTEVDFGGPFRLDFTATRNGAQLVISPYDHRVFGKDGEEYYGFSGLILPAIEIRDPESQKSLGKGKMGTC